MNTTQNISTAAPLLSAERSPESAKLGMLVFVVSEAMIFGCLLCAFLVFRVWYPDAFHEASWALGDRFGLAGLVFILLSSFTLSMALYSARNGNQSSLTANLFFTLVCAVAFLAVKFLEFSSDILAEYLRAGFFSTAGLYDPQISLFFSTLFLITCVQALHVMVGMGLLVRLISGAVKNRYGRQCYSPLDTVGLYWHMASVAGIFIFSLWYLI